MPISSRQKAGCLIAVVVVFGSISVLMLILGVLGLVGDARPMSLVCDRAKGTCELHDRAHFTYRIDEIVGVELKTDRVSIGSRGASERQSWIVMHFKDAPDRIIAEGSGDPTSMAEYKRAADDISAFFAGKTATLDARYSVRLGTDSIVQDLLMGVFGVGLFVVVPLVFLRSSRRNAKKFDDAMKLREAQDPSRGGTPPTPG